MTDKDPPQSLSKSGRPSTPAHFWRWLTEPSSSIQDPERRRRARSLSVLLITTLVLAILAVVLTLLPINPTSPEEKELVLRVEWVAFIFLAGIYILSRSRHSALAATLTVGVFLVSTYSTAIYEPRAPAIMAYVVLGGLVSSLFLSPRTTAVIFVLTCIGLQALYWPLNIFPGPDVFRAVFFALIVGILVVVATIVRQQDLQQIEQQSRTLAEREKRLVITLETANNANEKLLASMRALEQSNRETTLLAQLGELLQACATAEESYQAIGHIAPDLFTGFLGVLFVYSPSRDDLDPVVKWGKIPEALNNRMFEPDNCWSLRRGRPYQADGLCMGLLCRSKSLATNSLCVPMMAQGETLGVLYLLGEEPGRTQLEAPTANEPLAVTTAEHIALALANLRLRETLRSQAIRDPLTGLFNRRFMEETLAREIRRAERNQHALGVIMLDLDHFKRFNDTFGHEAGDVLLRRVGEFLKANTRGGDIACRFGGEEFVIVLPETTLENIHRRAEEIRAGVKELTVTYHGQSLGTITASLGIAVFPVHATAVEALLRVADQALYRAKDEGRDRVVAANAPENQNGEPSD